jgi:hypothetical protein
LNCPDDVASLSSKLVVMARPDDWFEQGMAHSARRAEAWRLEFNARFACMKSQAEKTDARFEATERAMRAMSREQAVLNALLRAQGRTGRTQRRRKR